MRKDAGRRTGARPRVAITLGDPRGIGREVTTKALAEGELVHAAEFLVIGPGPPLPGIPHRPVGRWAAGEGAEAAGKVAALAIEEAARLALVGEIDAVVTAPIDKGALRAAGWSHPGHTEMLQQLSDARQVGMMMVAERTRLGSPLRVLLATTHIPLRQVPERVTTTLLVEQTTLLTHALARWWGIESPRIALCALNPHASDGGLFGDEEERVYRPALDALRSLPARVEGPIPADTVFARALAGEFDAVLAPYHDVGMAAFKTVSFGHGVNVTLGLPFPRTSPDHGTALDIAGRGTASASSMAEAIRLAVHLAGHADKT